MKVYLLEKSNWPLTSTKCNIVLGRIGQLFDLRYGGILREVKPLGLGWRLSNDSFLEDIKNTPKNLIKNESLKFINSLFNNEKIDRDEETFYSLIFYLVYHQYQYYDSYLVIDQIEAGLHPKNQMALLEELISFSLSSSIKTIIFSHSPYIFSYLNSLDRENFEVFKIEDKKLLPSYDEYGMVSFESLSEMSYVIQVKVFEKLKNEYFPI